MAYIKPPCIALCELYHCMFCFIVFFFLIGSCLIGCAWHWEEEQLKLPPSGRSLQVIEILISLPPSHPSLPSSSLPIKLHWPLSLGAQDDLSLSLSPSPPSFPLLFLPPFKLTSFFRSPGWPWQGDPNGVSSGGGVWHESHHWPHLSASQEALWTSQENVQWQAGQDDRSGSVYIIIIIIIKFWHPLPNDAKWFDKGHHA